MLIHFKDTALAILAKFADRKNERKKCDFKIFLNIHSKNKGKKAQNYLLEDHFVNHHHSQNHGDYHLHPY